MRLLCLCLPGFTAADADDAPGQKESGGTKVNQLSVSPSPHLGTPDNTRSIMLDVIVALSLPSVFGIVMFGWHAALCIAVCVGSCVLFEYLGCKAFGHANSIGDLSAVVTGLLLALNLPPLRLADIWIAVIGSFAAIFVVKQMFGGLGHNFVNPALDGSFPAVNFRPVTE